MLNKYFIKKTAVFVILFFSFFIFQSNFNYSNEEDILKKARSLINDGFLNDAITELTQIIDKLKNIDEKRKKVAEAYYLLARVHYDGGDENKFEKNIRMVYKVYPDFKTDESNFELKEKVEKIKNSMNLKIQPDKKAETKEVIVKKGKKKKKKKFPVLLIVAAVAAIAAAVLLLSKKESESSSTPLPSNQLANEVYNSIEWVNIPAGEFQMGDNFNEGEEDERPVHTVYLDTYYISNYEVTFDKYDKFCDDTGRTKPSDESWGRGNRPVINISWENANAFCDWLTSKIGNTVSLPTEAQWEKAARGTDQRRYPWGNGSPNSSLCNYNGIGTQPVGSYSSGVSPYGIHDMAGNVWELCSDWFSASYYSSSPTNNPTGPSLGSYRVIKGGSWYNSAYNVRSANRGSRTSSDTNFNVGFRLIRLN